MSRKILIGYDHSDISNKAINWVIGHDILSPTDTVTVATVINEDCVAIEGTFGLEAAAIEPSYWGDDDDGTNKLEPHAKVALKQVIRSFQNIGIEPVAKILRGEAGEALKHEAQDQGADMVIVGNRGLGFLKRQILGSVSEYLLYHLKCPVLVVKPENKQLLS